MASSLLAIYPKELSPEDIEQISHLCSGAEIELIPEYISESIAFSYGFTHATQLDGICYRIHMGRLNPIMMMVEQQPLYVGKYNKKDLGQLLHMSFYLEGICKYQAFIKIKIKSYSKAFKKHFGSPSAVNLAPMGPMSKELTKDLGCARRALAALFAKHRLF